VAITALREAAAAVRAEAAARYPVLVDTTHWAVLDGRPMVGGSVLVPAQADAYQEALAAFSPDDRPVVRPIVLTDLGTTWHKQRWARGVGEGPLDLHRRPDGDDLQTQWPCATWLRWFAADPSGGPRALVQILDGTVGWVDGRRLDRSDEPERDPWEGVQRAEAKRAVSGGDLEAAAAAARRRLGRPYLWGGNTEAAADCSGFVQAVAYEAAGVLLPKNTKDQLRRGARVAVTDLRPGDFVYVQGRDKRVMHVGLALPVDDSVWVIHSCLSRGRVLEESLSDFLEMYRFVGGRRIVAWGAA
jgi:hypothetical protein